MRRIQGVYLADTARVLGQVTLGADVGVWHHAVIRGDVAAITVGEGTNVQDGAVLHCDSGHALVVGRRVTIGHHAIVHGVSVGDEALVGMGATMLGGSRIGRGAILAAGAVLAPGNEIPDGMLAVGVPAKVVRPVRDDEIAYNQRNVDHYIELARLHADHPDDPRTRAYGS